LVVRLLRGCKAFEVLQPAKTARDNLAVFRLIIYFVIIIKILKKSSFFPKNDKLSDLHQIKIHNKKS